MTHIEIQKISEQEVPKENEAGVPIKIPGHYEKDGKTPLTLKVKVVEVHIETIKIDNIKSYRHWRKSTNPEWKKIEGDTTVLFMESDEKKNKHGVNVPCTILIHESYDSFSRRIKAIRSEKSNQTNECTQKEAQATAVR